MFFESWRRLAATLLIALAPALAGAEERVWILSDPCVHMKADPDDVLTFRVMMAAGETPLGMSITKGNCVLDRTWATAQRFSPWTPIYKETNAVNALIAALEKAPLRVLAFGPLTDLAAVLRVRPDLASQIVDVVFVGGRLPGEVFWLNPNWSLFRGMRDLNVEEDVPAVASVLEAGVTLRLIPFAAGAAVRFNHGVFNRVATDDEMEAATNWAGNIRMVSLDDDLPGFDQMAWLYLKEPNHFRCGPVRLTLEDGQLIANQTAETSQHQYCVPADPAVAKAAFLDYITPAPTDDLLLTDLPVD